MDVVEELVFPNGILGVCWCEGVFATATAMDS